LFATYNILFAVILPEPGKDEVMQGVTEVLCYGTAIVADRI
jgi:hypothetical protein